MNQKCKENYAVPYKTCVALFAIYLFIALAMYARITLDSTHVANAFPFALADLYQNMWNLWWVKHALIVHTSIFHTNLLFWPLGTNLVYQVMSPIAGVVSIPFQAFGLTFAINALFFLGFALSGATMFVLAEYLTRNRYAAFLAGLFFTFSAFHMALAPSHPNLMNIEWVPMFVYFTLKIANERNGWYRNAVGLGISFVLISFMGDFEQSVMSVLLFLLIVAFFASRDETRGIIASRRFAAAILVSAVVAFLFGIWGFIPLLKSLTTLGLGQANVLNTEAFNIGLGENVFSFFMPPFFSVLSISFLHHYWAYRPVSTETVPYVGYTVLLLAAYALYRGKWRREALLWIAIAVIFALMALGPVVKLGALTTKIPTLYALYRLVPVINIVREPGRFDLIVTIAAAILAAMGASLILERYKSRSKKAAVTVALAILFLIECNSFIIGRPNPYQPAVSVQPVPEFYYYLHNMSGNFSVIEIPSIPDWSTYPGLATYYTSITGKPLVGGYVSRRNASDVGAILSVPLAVADINSVTGWLSYPSPINENLTNQTLLSLYRYNTSFVIVMKDAYNGNSLRVLGAYLNRTFGEPVYAGANVVAYNVVGIAARSAYKSFVAYYQYGNMSEVSWPYHGNVRNYWLFNNVMELTVYAPNSSAHSNTPVMGMPTEMSFNAIAVGTNVNDTISNTTLHVSAIGDGSRSYADVVLKRQPHNYSVYMNLTPGPSGNKVVLEVDNGIIGIANITFSSVKAG
ncbi:MAG: hypothetical protein KGH94_03570 [Candidatus Micrarchaeota archaeon]|nr:hypothetical protein [Candidatus Micrarchaeota archaeon]